MIVAAGCTSSNLILISLLYRDCLRGAEWKEPAFPWTNTSSKTGPGIVSVTSRTRHPVIRSNEDDCQLSTCAGLMIFSFGTGDAGMAAGFASQAQQQEVETGGSRLLVYVAT